MAKTAEEHWETIKKNAAGQWDKLIGLGAEGAAQANERIVPGEGKGTDIKKDAAALGGVFGEAWDALTGKDKQKALAESLREEEDESGY